MSLKKKCLFVITFLYLTFFHSYFKYGLNIKAFSAAVYASNSLLEDTTTKNLPKKIDPPVKEHSICKDNACVVVPGFGVNQCVTDADCKPKYYYTCEDNACVSKLSVTGNEKSTCATNNDCLVSTPVAPPSPDKELYYYTIIYYPEDPKRPGYFDPEVVPDIPKDKTIKQMHTDVLQTTFSVASYLTKGTLYKSKYKDAKGDYIQVPYISYRMPVLPNNESAIKVYKEPVPLGLVYYEREDGSKVYRPDYNKILNRENVCDLVDNKGIKQIWLWSYHTKLVEPAESNMSMGLISKKYWNYPDYGDVSNSERTNDLPQCKKTYIVFNYSYYIMPNVSNSVHDHGHQIEASLGYLAKFNNPFFSPGYSRDKDIFWTRFVGGRGYPKSVRGCGDVHFPPNAKREYDYWNTTPVMSACLNWHPTKSPSSLPKTEISCKLWTKTDDCKGEAAQVLYLTWWMQRIPNKDNGISFKYAWDRFTLNNWWDVIYDIDLALAKETGLFNEKRSGHYTCMNNSCSYVEGESLDSCKSNFSCINSPKKLNAFSGESTGIENIAFYCPEHDFTNDCKVDSADLDFLAKRLFNLPTPKKDYLLFESIQSKKYNKKINLKDLILVAQKAHNTPK